MDKNTLNSTKPDALLAWMESLADSTRLRLLRLLERHELGVVELCDVLQLPQSTVSRHLKVLSGQGWVRSARRGTTNLYRMILDELSAPARKLWLVAREQTDAWATAEQDQLRLARVLREREQDARSFFAGAAGEWDKLRSELYGERFSLEAMLALLPRDYVVADLGCGTGTLVAQLAPHVRHVIGVDLSPEMLRSARRRVEGLENVELEKGDLAQVPIPSNRCDAALCVLALTYVDDPQKAVGEMARIVRPRGVGVIADLLPHDRDDFRRTMGQKSSGLSERDVRAMLATAGFVQTRFTTLSPQPGAKGPALFLASAVRSG